jgi:hypothetical protein
MSKADGKCNKCKGKGFVNSPVVHMGFPGGCFRCDMAGTYEAEAAIKARGKKLKATQAIVSEVTGKIFAVRSANPGVRMTREERHWCYEQARFVTQDFADKFGYTKREAWIKLCSGYPNINVDADWETGEIKGWAGRSF